MTSTHNTKFLVENAIDLMIAVLLRSGRVPKAERLAEAQGHHFFN